MENKISEWFSDEVIFERYFSSILWTVVLQTAVIFSAVISTSLFYNTSDVLPAVVQFVFSLIFTISFAVVHIKNVSVIPRTSVTLLEAAKVWLSLQRWLTIFCFSVLGILCNKCFSSLLGNFSTYEESVICSTTGTNCCLSEKNFFAILHGAFFGLLFGCRYFINCSYLLEFHTIQQLKFPTAKLRLKEVMSTSVVVVFKNLKWFYLFYYLFGNCLKSIITTATNSSFCNHVSLTTLNGLMDLHLFWVTFLSAVVLCIIWSAFIALFQLCMTEHYQFEVEAVMENDTHKTLNNVLQCSSIPIMQYLALNDFSYLSQHSAVRRTQIFQVSNPGGHPLQWNALCGCILKLIDNFLMQLLQVSAGPTDNILPKEQVPKKPMTPKTPMQDDFRLDKSLDSSTRLASPLAYRRTFIKNIASPPGYPKQQSFFRDGQRRPYVANDFAIFRSATTWVSSKVSLVKEAKFVKYFTAEMPEARLERIFVSSQPVIWAIQGLCFIVRASFREDKYGVVQRWLPDILAKLLDLQNALERSQKMSTKKQCQGKRGVRMKESLRTALSTGLYCIVCTFKHHLACVRLTEEHRQRLLQYENFMT